MIDLLLVFKTGGEVLWQRELQKVPQNVINSFVADVFVDSVGEKQSWHKNNYTVKYSTSNHLGLVFVAVYQSMLQLSHVDELVDNMKKIFVSLWDEDGVDSRFDAMLDSRIQELEPEQNHDGRNNNTSEAVVEEEAEKNQLEQGQVEEKPKTRRGGKKKPVAATNNKSSKKKKRTWTEDGLAEEDDGDQVLDYSTGGSQQENFNVDQELTAAKTWGDTTKQGFVLKELDDILTDEPAQESFGFLRNIIGGKTLSQQDLTKALSAMRDHLIEKNVASEVADHLCGIVDKSLVGAKTQSWTSVQATVKKSMTEALRRILTPKTSVDLLREVQSRGQRPYVISVVGVNGVGKSTNLSKLGFWLLQNNMKVLVAACDTFRSGAVEQLKVHVRRLQELTNRTGCGEVQIFDEGYGKDAAVIASRAVEHGQRNGFDVVLIDTAGRRHNDDRLMSSLEKFGKLASPDKVIMVGEALVGTDSVQQAKNFNAAFGPSRNLDFFLISKCDTVGDMIGSMVNMTYSTSIPVLFVGVGQNYTDLRNLSVEWAVNLLMS